MDESKHEGKRVVQRPSEVGLRGTFYAAAVNGCPCCRMVIEEPEGDDPMSVVCPECEFVLTWVPEEYPDETEGPER